MKFNYKGPQSFGARG